MKCSIGKLARFSRLIEIEKNIQVPKLFCLSYDGKVRKKYCKAGKLLVVKRVHNSMDTS